MRKLTSIFILTFANLVRVHGAADSTGYRQFEQGFEKCQYVVEGMVINDEGNDTMINDILYKSYRVYVLTSVVRMQVDDTPPIVNRKDTLSVLVNSSGEHFRSNDSLLGKKENFVFLLLRKRNSGTQDHYFVLADEESSVVPRSANYLNYVYANHFYIGTDPSHILVLPDTFRISMQEARMIAKKKAGHYYCQRGKWYVYVLPDAFGYTWRVYSVRKSNSLRIYKRSGNGIKKIYEVEISASTGKIVSRRCRKPIMPPD